MTPGASSELAIFMGVRKGPEPLQRESEREREREGGEMKNLPPPFYFSFFIEYADALTKEVNEQKPGPRRNAQPRGSLVVLESLLSLLELEEEDVSSPLSNSSGTRARRYTGSLSKSKI